MADAFGDHKQHGHHDNGHMMMPHSPFAYLVVGYAEFTFCVFKYAIHPEALTLHPAQEAQRCSPGRVCQRDFEIWVDPKVFCSNQLPAFGCFRSTVSHINPQAAAPNFQFAPKGVAKRHWAPSLRGKRFGNLLNLIALQIRLKSCRGTTAFARLSRNRGSRILQIYMRIAMHTDLKVLADFIKGLAKSRSFIVGIPKC